MVNEVALVIIFIVSVVAMLFAGLICIEAKSRLKHLERRIESIYGNLDKSLTRYDSIQSRVQKSLLLAIETRVENLEMQMGRYEGTLSEWLVVHGYVDDDNRKTECDTACIGEACDNDG